MEKIFLSVLNMSLTASFVIAAIMLARLPLKKAPKIISYALWAVAGFRLVVPFTLESIFSLLPFKSAPIPTDIGMQAVPRIDSGIALVDNAVSAVLPAATFTGSVNPMQIWIAVGSYAWLIGMAVMLIYSVVSIILLKKRLQGALLVEGNLYEADNLKTPFVIGLFNPRIYIPAGLSGEERRYIILHEQTHIRRHDHAVKMFAYFVLCLHWFNPFAWAAFLLMGADMEMSCDERVLKEMGDSAKKAYSLSLLTMATERRIIGSSPLAFGEGGMKERIKNILNFKKSSRVIIIAAVVLAAVLTIGFAVNRADNDTPTTEPNPSITGLAEASQKMPFPIFIPTEVPAGLVAELTIEEGPPDFVRIEYRSKEGGVRLTVVNGPAGSGLAFDPRKSGETIHIRGGISGHYLINQPEFGGPILWWEEAGSYVALSGPDMSKTDLANIADSMSSITEDWQPQPEIEDQDEPYALQQATKEWTLITEADLTSDGLKELIYLDKSQMDSTNDVTLRILDRSGSEIWSESANTAHTGWNQLFLCEQEGEYYLMRYHPTMFQGISSYVYTLFSLEDGKEKVYKTNTLDFEVNGRKELDIPPMIAFADEVNELLGKSILLMSTEGGVYSFGPAPATPFWERYSWLDGFPELNSTGDLKTRLEEYNEHAKSRREIEGIE